MREGGGGGRIGKIISRYVDSLYRGNGPVFCGSDSLLKLTKICGQGGLVTHSGGDSSQQSTHLGVSLGETENIINEQQHVSVLLVSEVLGDGKSGKPDSGSSTGGLVHLSVHKRGSASFFEINYFEFLHFSIQIISLSGTFSHTGEYRVSSMMLSDVSNEFHNQHGLSDSCSSEKSDFSSSLVWGEKIYDLDTGDKEFLLRGLVFKVWGLSVDGVVGLGVDWASLVDRFSNYVHNSAEGFWTYWDFDGVTSVLYTLSSNQTFGGVQSDGSDLGVTKMLGYFQN